jgi:hypothetical protein
MVVRLIPAQRGRLAIGCFFASSFPTRLQTQHSFPVLTFFALREAHSVSQQTHNDSKKH